MNELPKPEWVKLVPSDSIPVFCLSPDTLDQDLHYYSEQLRAFFGDRKVLVIRGVVQIYAITNTPQNVATLLEQAEKILLTIDDLDGFDWLKDYRAFKERTGYPNGD